MKKTIIMILLLCFSVSLFAGNMFYYYGYENRYAVSIGAGYDYYNMELKDANGNYQPLFTINGMTANIKAEMPLRSMSGISLFLDTSFMIPSTGYVESSIYSGALHESTHLADIAQHDGLLNYFMIDNNIGINMLGSMTPSLFFYYGGGLDVMIGHSSYKYNDGSDDQTLKYGYLGMGLFQTIGMYYEFTNNLALNVGINASYDFLIYKYVIDSADSTSNIFEKIAAKGKNYAGKVMLTYNF